MSPLRLARFWLAAAILASASPCLAQAVSITNVAQARWSDGTTAHAISSNAVVLDVVADTVDLTLMRMDDNATTRTTINGASCPAATAMAEVRIGVTDASTLTQGETLVIAVDAPAANTDAARIDTIAALVAAMGSGDRETLTLHETGVDTGKFAGVVRTAAVPPAPITGDCTLALLDGDKVTVTVTGDDARVPLASQTVGVPVDPRGKVFDSNDGGPVNGARVTLVEADSGAPAQVFAPDLITRYPSSVVSGQLTTDSAGLVYKASPGMYQFPRVRPGRYRLVVEPPAPYAAPSTALPADIALIPRPNGKPWTIADASYGRPFTVAGDGLIRIDIPVDTPATALTMTKTASRAVAAAGDGIIYTIAITNTDATHVRRTLALTDTMPASMRLEPDSVRVDGARLAGDATLGADGGSLRLTIKRIAPGATVKITYAAWVRPDAATGAAVNRAVLTDPAGQQSNASVAVRIDGETIASRMTIVGRVIDGCAPAGAGVPDVRVTLEDGSYAVTDRDGRYHFEGLVPGDHVAQVDQATLPHGGRFVDCAASTRSAGRATSRFVGGQGGSLAIADFTADLSARTAAPTAIEDTPAPPSDRAAAGGERDWFANGSPSIGWLFPEPDHNPRAPAVRVAIRHLAGQKVELLADGKPVDAIAFDGSRDAPDRSFAVSLWRGIPLTGPVTSLTATVRNGDGTIAQVLTRKVRFVGTAARATYLPERSRLIADGIARPLIAVRITDGAGRPVHAGSVGDVALSAPYEAAQAGDAEQARMLSGLERASPTWRVVGDDGIAYIALAPTTASGALSLDFAFRDRDQVRRQRLDTWLSPGERSWTVVGLAQGRIGRHVEPGVPGNDLIDGRLALYAKGRILGRWLLTMAYDSGRRRQDQRLTGAIDPNTFYTVYADRSERRYDAASTRKLYLRLERRQFQALWGDFQTGFGDTELGRYQRAGTGFKVEARGRGVAASAFAARFASTHRRDEIQGNGLSVGYRLTTRPILANSETVAIEVRDRLRSERIVERRTLTRFVDYDIDYATGALRFSSPVLSRSSDLDPRFVVVDYEVDLATGERLSAGARGTWMQGAARLGATVVHDGDAGSDLGAVDVRVRVDTATELRGEAAVTRGTGHFAAAWTVELERHDARLDVLAYARQLDAGFGLAEQNTAERGRRKIGVDARLRLSERLSLTTSLWTDTDLTGPASRRAAKAELRYRTDLSEFRAGVTYADDHTANGEQQSTLLEAGVTRRLFDGKLEVDAGSAVALGTAASVVFPARHRLGARLQISPDVALTGLYELATGDGVDARTARIGFDVKPWAGARLTSALASQDIAEQGRRAYAAYGLAQSWPVTPRLSLDASLDGEHTLHGIDPARIVNPAHPVASGGYIGAGADGAPSFTEDFTAATLGATYRADRWSVTGRGEYRFGSLGDRAAATLGVLRQLGEGTTAGLLATWTRATPLAGVVTGATNIAGSLALRPAGEVVMLAKLEYRSDMAEGITSRRAIASLTADWLPRDRAGRERGELGLFVGARYSFDRVEGSRLAGTATMVGIDARLALGSRIELGATGTLRGDLARGAFAYAYGPALGIRPATDMLVTAGWNVRGFADRDFAGARSTRAGPYMTIKLKLDRDSFSFLGLRR